MIEISIIACAVSVVCAVIVVISSKMNKEPLLPSFDQLRRFIKLMVTGKYEPPRIEKEA